MGKTSDLVYKKDPTVAIRESTFIFCYTLLWPNISAKTRTLHVRRGKNYSQPIQSVLVYEFSL
jgi:hypothetical protein